MNDPVDSTGFALVGSLDEFVANGINELRILAEAGNNIAREWLMQIEAASNAHMKLSLFGEMKVALRLDKRSEAVAIWRKMFTGE